MIGKKSLFHSILFYYFSVIDFQASTPLKCQTFRFSQFDLIWFKWKYLISHRKSFFSFFLLDKNGFFSSNIYFLDDWFVIFVHKHSKVNIQKCMVPLLGRWIFWGVNRVTCSRSGPLYFEALVFYLNQIINGKIENYENINFRFPWLVSVIFNGLLDANTHTHAHPHAHTHTYIHYTAHPLRRQTNLSIIIIQLMNNVSSTRSRFHFLFQNAS